MPTKPIEGPIEAPVAVTAAPAAPQISVREWALSQADTIGLETALAFTAMYGSDTGTAAKLEAALAEMRGRVVHKET